MKRVFLIFFTTFIFISFVSMPGTAATKEKWKSEKESALNWIDRNREVLTELSDTIWEAAETALLEHNSSRALIGILEKEGFSVQKGVGLMETAFIAEYGHGAPVIGILAEYDALPGISQARSPVKTPLVQGAPGHGCGHNLFGAASTGAALAVKAAMEKYKIPGTIKLFGCPAEETLVGKSYMAREGVFDGLDAAIAWHPGSSTGSRTGSSQAMNNFKVTFSGQTAHAAGDPWNGRSALDAVELMNAGVNFMREHIPPTARIHYVIPDGGLAPNVVPDRATVWYYVREKDRESVDAVYQKVLNIMKGAAMMTGTEYNLQFITAVHSTLPNLAGARSMDRNLHRIGPPVFTPEEQKFAKDLQESFGKEQKGLSGKIEDFEENPRFSGGSSDVAEVSRITPTAQISAACWPPGIPGHSWGIVAASGHSMGHKGMLIAAKAMALTAVDFLRDSKLRKEMTREFQKATRDHPYRSPLPDDWHFIPPVEKDLK